MGTWGPGPFDNHAARDLLAAISDGSFDFNHFKASCTREYVDADEAEIIIALGAISKLREKELPDFIPRSQYKILSAPENRAWLRKKISQAMVPGASELYALWETTGEMDQWLHTAQASKP